MPASSKPQGCLGNDHGFSLLELVAALTLLALLAAIFGMGLVAALQSHEFSRANVRLAQKAHPAMARMTRELMELTAIDARKDSGTHPYILYRRMTDDATRTSVRYGLHHDTVGGSLLLYTDYPVSTALDGATVDQGDVLVDGVSSFRLNFKSGLEEDWTDNDLQKLSHIEIILDLYHPGSTQLDKTRQFRTTVHLRNTSNFGGAAATTRPASVNNYSCFIGCLQAEQ